MVNQDFKPQTVKDIWVAELNISRRVLVRELKVEEALAILRQLKAIMLVALFQASILPWSWSRWMSLAV
ncbi:hypothetical protein V5O48_014883 [Marasmius crinis-equi]|uniref:Uncharacterized protein n=1 Tax=Marasmius crinis-equi TaxID=585013 RepID=A0ABR3EW20_9AGAR